MWWVIESQTTPSGQTFTPPPIGLDSDQVEDFVSDNKWGLLAIAIGGAGLASFLGRKGATIGISAFAKRIAMPNPRWFKLDQGRFNPLDTVLGDTMISLSGAGSQTNMWIGPGVEWYI